MRCRRRCAARPSAACGQAIGSTSNRRCASATPEGEAVNLRFSAPAEVLRYTIEKGSITVAGVSLTVVDVDDEGFSVTVIPHTQEVTSLGSLRPGSPVNLEADVFAKYVEKLGFPRASGTIEGVPR